MGRAVESDMLQNSSPCTGRFHLHHTISVYAAFRFDRQTVDIILRMGVQLDIMSWLHVMKPGGHMTFNDYGTGAFPGVDSAVHDFAEGTKTDIVELGNGNAAIQLTTNKLLLVTQLPWPQTQVS